MNQAIEKQEPNLLEVDPRSSSLQLNCVVSTVSYFLKYLFKEMMKWKRKFLAARGWGLKLNITWII